MIDPDRLLAASLERLPVEIRLRLVLSVAVLAISSAAVLVRLIDAGTPVSVAFWRAAITGGVLLPMVRLRRIDRRDLAWIALSGSFLAAHVVSWFASLALTSVMRSTVLVCTAPIWVGLMETSLSGVRLGRRFWLGTLLALAGVSAFTASGLRGPIDGGGRGEGLALLGAFLAAAYFLIGRQIRPRVDLVAYAALVSTAAAIWLAAVAWVSGIGLATFEPATWSWLILLALGPQLLGHNGFNYALRYAPASRIAVLLLLEPVGAALLAALFLGEYPPARAVIASGVVLIGVGLTSRPAELAAGSA